MEPTLQQSLAGVTGTDTESHKLAVAKLRDLFGRELNPEEKQLIATQNTTILDEWIQKAKDLFKSNPEVKESITVKELPKLPKVDAVLTSSVEELGAPPQQELLKPGKPMPMGEPWEKTLARIQQTGDQRLAILNKAWDTSEAAKPYKENLDNITTQLNTARNEFVEAGKAAQTEYEKKKIANEWAGVAETFGNALMQLAAGWYGLKNGVDLSGIPFNKTDWEGKIRGLQVDLDNKVQRARENLAMKEAPLAEQRAAEMKREAGARETFEQDKQFRADQLAQQSAMEESTRLRKEQQAIQAWEANRDIEKENRDRAYANKLADWKFKYQEKEAKLNREQKLQLAAMKTGQQFMKVEEELKQLNTKELGKIQGALTVLNSSDATDEQKANAQKDFMIGLQYFKDQRLLSEDDVKAATKDSLPKKSGFIFKSYAPLQKIVDLVSSELAKPTR